MNKALYEMSLEREEFQGMGCTLVAAVIEEGILYAANVGDSRLYLIHQGSFLCRGNGGYGDDAEGKC